MCLQESSGAVALNLFGVVVCLLDLMRRLELQKSTRVGPIGTYCLTPDAEPGPEPDGYLPMEEWPVILTMLSLTVY